MNNNSKAIDLLVRLFFVGLVFTWCFLLLRPFLTMILWGAILAIACYPLFLWLKALLGRRSKLAALILTLLGIGIIIGPIATLGIVMISNLRTLADHLASGLLVPPPPESVADWPLIGERLFNFWQEVSLNLKEVAKQFEPQIKELAKNALLLAGNIGVTILKFIISLIITAAFTLNAAEIKHRLLQFSERLAPERGEDFLQLATLTIRNVTRGIIGVAIVQSLLVGIGLIVAGIPWAGVLTLLCFLLTIIQIGPALIILGTIIFAWSTMSSVTALLFTIWMIFAALIDNFLKPIWMAQGLPIPMVIILVGVFGGVLLHGIIGLFIGPVITGLGYELIKTWLKKEPSPPSLFT